jgi:hypothetical protein
MDQIEIFEDDGDPRNARARIVRHSPGVLRPGTYPAPARQYPVAYPQPMYQPVPQPAYQPAIYPSYQAPVIVQRRGRIADLPTGQVLELAAQAFAALQSLPAAPAPVGATETDVANLITYQSALAQHAKRDEQLRTVGALLSKLLA